MLPWWIWDWYTLFVKENIFTIIIQLWRVFCYLMRILCQVWIENCTSKISFQAIMMPLQSPGFYCCHGILYGIKGDAIGVTFPFMVVKRDLKTVRWHQFTEVERHICVSKLTSIGSDNCLVRWQAIIWTNAGILLIGSWGTNFSEILIEIHTFSFIWKCCLENGGHFVLASMG